MLYILKGITHHIFSVGPIDPDNLKHYKEMIDMFNQSYVLTGLTVSTKVHWLCWEVFPWIEKWGLKLGFISEQDGESLHHHLERYKNYNPIHGENYKCLHLIKWNRERRNKHPNLRSRLIEEDEEKDLEQLIKQFKI